MAAPPSSRSRDKILDVAEARFAQRGYAGVGLRELAEAAGLSKSSLFHHFPSKAALYCSALDRVLQRLAARLAPHVGRPGPAGPRLDALLDDLLDLLAEQATTSRLLLRALFEDDDLPEAGLPEVEAMNATLNGILAGVRSFIEQGVADGSFRPVSAAHTLQSLIGVTIYHFASGDFGEELLGKPIFSAEAVQERRSEVKAFVRHGLLARGARPEMARRKEST